MAAIHGNASSAPTSRVARGRRVLHASAAGRKCWRYATRRADEQAVEAQVRGVEVRRGASAGDELPVTARREAEQREGGQRQEKTANLAAQPRPLQGEQAKQREPEVEMLLDGQAPRVLARRAEVVLQVQQVRAQRVGDLCRLAVRALPRKPEREKREVGEVGRPDIQAASHEKSPHVDRARAAILGEQQLANQVTTQHKEEIHAGPTHAIPRARQRRERAGRGRIHDVVAAERQQDRDGAQHVDGARAAAPFVTRAQHHRQARQNSEGTEREARRKAKGNMAERRRRGESESPTKGNRARKGKR